MAELSRCACALCMILSSVLRLSTVGHDSTPKVCVYAVYDTFKRSNTYSGS